MPERLLSQLAHVEVLTPTPEETLRFCVDVLGLEHSGTDGASAYLRGWGDFFHHTLQVTEGDAPGLGHIGWRAEGPEQLEVAVARIEATGAGEGWLEDAIGSRAGVSLPQPGRPSPRALLGGRALRGAARAGRRRSRTGHSGTCRAAPRSGASTT